MSNCVKQTLESFRFSVLPINTITGINPVISLTAGVERTIATLTVPVDCDDFVWLNGTVGWHSGAATTTLTFKIYRDIELTPIFSTADTLGGTDLPATTSFSHVDYNFPKTTDCVTYILTVTSNVTGATLTGPITFIAAVIENKRHHEENKCDHEENKCEPKCENKCEPRCEHKCEPKCKPHHKPYYQSYDFD